MGDVQMPSGMSSRMPRSESTKSRMRKMSRREMGTDFGLVPGTYIPFKKDETPGWFGKDYKVRFRSTWARVKGNLQSFGS